MTKILVVTDSDSLASELELQLAGPHTEVRRFADGRAALVAVALDAPDVVICDMQVSNMGGIAICMDLKLEAGAGRLPEVPVLLLLDRPHDVFLARRAHADAWLVKPFHAHELRRTVHRLVDAPQSADALPAQVPAGNPG